MSVPITCWFSVNLVSASRPAAGAVGAAASFLAEGRGSKSWTRTSPPGFKRQRDPLLALWSWANRLTFLCLRLIHVTCLETRWCLVVMGSRLDS